MDGRKRLTGAFEIELARIRADPNQPRKGFDPAELDELVETIRRLGIITPITVQYIEADNTYQIITGERRFQAARLAGLKTIPCCVRSPDAEDVLVQQIVENWQRADLKPFELADSLARLRDAHGYSQTELAKATGKNKSEISRSLSLLDLEPDVQTAARHDAKGRITKRHLFALARLTASQQRELLRQIQDHNLTAIDTEKRTVRTQRTADGGRKAGVSNKRWRFKTNNATVVVTFRKRDSSNQDVLAALREAIEQVPAS